ncbi:hypothetical protein ECC02_011270 [Trypanosoma cruzi]|uniref:Uncharacterized protein n=1 Tax=Trypanosoma cruzi TaxID=5693 RepID=A0A7J6XNB2_TRYCR|nr:hypothetical protein ECC02_011270 [Trypanosoma cruzi]
MPTQKLKHQHYFPPQRSQLHHNRSTRQIGAAPWNQTNAGTCWASAAYSLLLPSSFRWIRSRGDGCVCGVPSLQQHVRAYKYVCVRGQCVLLLVLSETSNFTVAISACFLSFLPSVSVFKKWRVQQQQRQYTRKVSEKQSRAPTQRAATRDNPEGTAQRTIAHRKEQQRGKSQRAVGVCGPALTRCNTPHPTGNDRQTGGERDMNGCRQEALTINMAREHAATPRRNTGGEGDRRKARSSITHTEGTNDRREKHRQRPSPWPATPHQPSHTHKPSQCRQSAGERIRPSTQQTHTPPAIIHQ